MYKMLFAAILLSSSVAFAEQPAAPAGGPGAGGPDPAAMQQNFQERKAQMSAKMSERIAEMQKRKACVDGAANPEALKACFPNRGKFGKHGGGDGKWGDGEGRRKFGQHRKFGGGGGEGAPASEGAGE